MSVIACGRCRDDRASASLGAILGMLLTLFIALFIGMAAYGAWNLAGQGAERRSIAAFALALLLAAGVGAVLVVVATSE